MMRLLLKSNYKDLKYVSRFKTTSTEFAVYHDKSYQYLHESEFPTSLYQTSLPRLPVPELNETITKYLNAVKPVVDPNTYLITEKISRNFLENEGKLLQDLLKAFDNNNKDSSYISEMWFHMYLSDRKRLPLNYNPCLIFQDEPKPVTQLIRTTNLIVSSLRFRRSLMDNVLYPEVFFIDPKVKDKTLYKQFIKFLPKGVKTYGSYIFKAYPLDISQYSRLFNTTRIPRITKDEIYTNMESKHIAVLRRGVFYKVNVLKENGDIVPPNTIHACIQHILNNTQTEPNPISVFTSKERNDWAKIREELLKEGNKEKLELIDSALFTVSLDEQKIEDYVSLVKTFLYENAPNRWFDKSFSLIVNKDAKAAVNFEHSWGDGVAVLRYFQEVLKDSIEKPQVTEATDSHNVNVSDYLEKIEFNLSNNLKSEVQTADKEHKDISDSVDVNVVEYRTFGRKLCRKHGISPDFVMQLSFQLAYYKQTNQFESVYESCSTAAFKHGRTETMRPLTSNTRDLCIALANKSKSNDAEIYNMMKSCSKNHMELTKNAAMGKGFDRHLFALKIMAEKNNLTIPELFKDEAYNRVNNSILSTSTLNSEAVLAGGFGPVNKIGYGIGYTIMNDFLGAVISNYKQNTNGNEFAVCLKSSFDDIYEILSKTP